MRIHSWVDAIRRLVSIVVAIAIVGLLCPTSAAQGNPRPRRFEFDIEPTTLVKDLLPAQPKSLPKLPPYLNEDLWEVPEVMVGEPIAADGKLDTEKATAHIIAKINYLDKRAPDGFLKGLVSHRAELHGLPFLMGDDCRSGKDEASMFAEIVQRAHNFGAIPEEEFWKHFKDMMESDARPFKKSAGVAAIMQIFGAASESNRVAMAKQLAAIRHVDSTRALAKLAIFAWEESVQSAAIDGLKGRPSKDFVPILLQGLRYPLPVTSTRAANALVSLQSKNVEAELIQVLEEPDPRAPFKRQIDDQEQIMVRELIRVNHHRNCLMCHAPANADKLPDGLLIAPVPLPDRPLFSVSSQSSSRHGGYGSISPESRSSPDLFVRIDRTYLRQDFSMMMRVENASPWPEMQRFDFLVRTRVLSADEAAECKKQIAKQGTPPSHLAAQYALRELTGQTPADTTPAAWRRLLKLPQPTAKS